MSTVQKESVRPSALFQAMPEVAFSNFISRQLKRANLGILIGLVLFFLYPAFVLFTAIWIDQSLIDENRAIGDREWNESRYLQEYTSAGYGDRYAESMRIDLLEFMLGMGITLILAALVWALVLFLIRRFLRVWFSSQKVRILWLRKFHSENRSKFRPSVIFDFFPVFGFSFLTIEDSRVKHSPTRTAILRTKMFMVLMIVPVLCLLWMTPFFVYLGFPSCPNYSCGIDELGTGMALISILVFCGLVFIAYAIAHFASVVILFLNKFRPSDDKKIIRRLRKNVLPKHMDVYRISDSFWRDAVKESLAHADTAIIDVSEVNANIAWEISEARSVLACADIIFICHGSPILHSDLTENQKEELLSLFRDAETNGTLAVYSNKRRSFRRRGDFESKILRHLHSRFKTRFN